MLRQQTVENQQVPLSIVQVQEHAEQEKRTTAKSSPLVTHLFSPIYLSRRQILTSFLLPLAWFFILAGMQWLQTLRFPNHEFSETWFYLRMSAFVLIPILMCSCLGYYLRTLRLAAVIGSFAGLLFYLATRLDFSPVWAFDYPYSSDMGNSRLRQHTECHLLPMNTRDLATAILLATFLTLAAAALSQIKQGRRTLYDRDSNTNSLC